MTAGCGMAFGLINMGAADALWLSFGPPTGLTPPVSGAGTLYYSPCMGMELTADECAFFVGGGNKHRGGSAANNGTTNSATPPPCQAKILNVTNNQFGTNYTDANVSSPPFNYSTGAPEGQGTLNLNIYGSTAGVSPGYYPVHWWTYAIGYGPTLHAVSGPGGNGGLDSTQTLQFGRNPATFHIDSGFPYNPIGAFFHWLLNMTRAGGYPQC